MACVAEHGKELAVAFFPGIKVGRVGCCQEHYIQLGHIGPKDCDDRSEQVRCIPDEALRLASA